VSLPHRDGGSIKRPRVAVGSRWAGVQAARSLKAAAKRYKTLDATLYRLLDEVGDTENTLEALKQLLKASTSLPIIDRNNLIAVLLHSPIK
jgi:hypothetical protein